MVQSFNASDDIVLEVKCLQAHIFLQAVDALNYLVVQVYLLIHLRVLVQSLHLAKSLQICLAHHQTSRLGTLEFSRLSRDSQLGRTEGLVWRLEKRGITALVLLHNRFKLLIMVLQRCE